MQTPPALDSRTNNFGFLRVLLAGLVVLHHSPDLLYGNRRGEMLPWIFGSFSPGAWAVDGFFIISGFLITKSWRNDPRFGSFLEKRVRRIYPGFAVASLVSVFIVGPLAQTAPADLLRWAPSTALNILTLNIVKYPVPLAFPHYPQLNNPLWTIRWEFACYILAGLAGLGGLSGRRWPWLVFFCSTGLLTLRPDLLGPSVPPQLQASVRLSMCFSAGALFFLYREKVRYEPWLAGLALLGLIVSQKLPSTGQLGITTFGAYLLFFVAFSKAPRLSRIGAKNDVSYGLYLYAWPIQQLLVLYIPGITLAAHVLASLALSFGMGYLSWRLVESPFLRKARRAGAPPPQPAA